MRYTVLLMILAAIAPRLTVAQEEVESKKATAAETPPETPESYIIQLTAFRMKSAMDPRVRAADIVAAFAKAKNDDTVQLVETIRLSAIGGAESIVQFSRRTAVTVGTVMSGRGGPPVRQTQFQETGTMVRITATPHSGKVLMKLSYEASRLEGEGTDDAPPDTETAELQTTQLFEIAKPTLVGGTTAGGTSFLILTVFAAE